MELIPSPAIARELDLTEVFAKIPLITALLNLAKMVDSVPISRPATCVGVLELVILGLFARPEEPALL